MNRRNFLRRSAAAIGSVALAPLLPLIPRPLNVPEFILLSREDMAFARVIEFLEAAMRRRIFRLLNVDLVSEGHNPLLEALP